MRVGMAIREPTEVDGVSDRSGFRRVAGAILDGARRKRREFAHALRICLRFMPFLRHERRRLLILVGLMLLTGLVSRVMPLIGKYMVDDVLPHHVWSMFWLVTVGLVGVSAILGLLSIYHSYVSLCLD